MNPLGMDYLTLYGMHPLDYIRTAASVGCAHVAFFTRALAFPDLPPAPPSLFDDASLRKDVRSCLGDHGVSIGLIDGFGFHGQVAAEDYRPMFDVLGALNVSRINTTSTAEWGRTVDETAALVEIAAEYDVAVTVEAIPTFTVGSLPQALELVRLVDRPNFRLLIDTMHVSRSGGAPLVTTLKPDLIGYVPLCDGPASTSATQTYIEEALHERLVPGDGEYPLVDMLKNVPSDIIVSLEVPMRAMRDRGVCDLDRAALAAAGARKVLRAAEVRSTR